MREFRWQILARWVMVAILALTAIIASARNYVDSIWPLFAVCAFIALYNFIILYTGWIISRPYHITLLSQFLDIIALTIFLHFSGNFENPLMYAYSIPVVAASVIVSKRAGFLLSGFASMLFFVVVCAALVNSFPFHLEKHHLKLASGVKLMEIVDPDRTGAVSGAWDYILTNIVTLAGLLFGSAYGFGTLSDRIREKEQQLQRENDRVRLLLGILPEGVALLTPRGEVEIANRAARALAGIADGAQVTAIDPRLGVQERFSAFDKSYDEFECTYNDRILNHILARTDLAGPVVWIIRDLTEQHRLMGQLMHQSKMADLGLLGAGIAHEIGNPLSSVSAILQLIEMRHPGPDVSERLRTARSHIERMSRILQDIRDFSRPSPGRNKSLLAAELVDKALQIFRLHEKSRHMTVEVTPPSEPLIVDVVEDQLVQVILNILLNAADASDASGAISVQMARTDSSIRISIADRGAGMSDAVREHLFTPFYTTKEPGKGVGLGLFISESIVRAHGGRIEVQSDIGRGSTFTIRLPLEKAAERRPTNFPSPSRSSPAAPSASHEWSQHAASNP